MGSSQVRRLSVHSPTQLSHTGAAPAPRLSRTPAHAGSTEVLVSGAHTEAVLREAGFSRGAIDDLLRDNVVAAAPKRAAL